MRTRSAIPRSLAALLVSLWLAPPSRADEATPPAEAGPVVRAISWKGVSALSESDLQERIFTQERPWWKRWAERPPFDEPTLEGDMQRIAATYREYSHYRARADYTLQWDETGHEVSIRITVDEGPAVKLESFAIELSEMPGGEARWKTLLVDNLPLHPGEPFTVANYGNAKRALLLNLGNAGFPDAKISGGGEVDLASNTATIAWAVHPGPRVIIGQIHISGQQTVSDEVIRRELTFKPGDVYTDAEIQKSQHNLSDLGLFRSALIDMVVDDPNAAPPEGEPPGKVTRDLNVRVEERPLRNVRIGLGYGTEDKLRAQLGWTHRNVFGRADSLDLHAKYSSLTDEFQATLREPHIPDPRTTLYIDSRIRDDTLPAYDDLALIGRSYVERPLRLGWSGSLGYDIEWDDVRKVASGIQSEVETFRLGMVELGVRRITTDNLVEPTRGTWLETNLQTASTWLGSEKEFVRWTLDARAFLPVGPTVFGVRGMVGSITGYGKTSRSELPVTELFYAGGSSNARGYDFQHFGTDNAPGQAIGGSSLLTVSGEWRFPIWQDLRGVTFIDSTQLSRNAWDWEPRQLRQSVGIGLRYSTPLGPIRVDLAAPLDPPPGVDHVRIWFAIGQAF
jgi:outer membrane protein insertion porin family